MVSIYDKKETDFSHNGLAVLDKTISCMVEEELNGYYGIELEYPIVSNDKKRKYIIEGNIIKANTPKGKQLFRIVEINKNIETIIVNARHIFYDLMDNFIENYRTGRVNAQQALEGMLSNLNYSVPHNGTSNIKGINDAYYVRKNPVDVIMGQENSIMTKWGGDIIRDNFTISLVEQLGDDKGAIVEYGKNIIGIEDEVDTTELITRIMPTGLKENDTVIMLPEKYIDSPLVEEYHSPKVKHIHLGEYKVNSDAENGEVITENEVFNNLRKYCYDQYTNGIDKPSINYVIDFIELSNTEEYKEYKFLEKLYLGDIVTVRHKELGIDTRQRITKYKYDSIHNEYVEIELGDLKKSIESTITETINSVKDVEQEVLEEKQRTFSKFEVTDDRISMNVEEINKTNAKLEITANEIRAEVNDIEHDLNSKIEITADRIQSEVNDINRNLSSRITQEADRIDLVVDGSGNVRGASIALAITESGSAIDLISDHIYIRPHDGVVHFPNGSDIDTRRGDMRMRRTDDNYLRISTNGDLDYRANGRLLFSVTDSGVYFKGQKLATMSDIPSIPTS